MPNLLLDLLHGKPRSNGCRHPCMPKVVKACSIPHLRDKPIGDTAEHARRPLWPQWPTVGRRKNEIVDWPHDPLLHSSSATTTESGMPERRTDWSDFGESSTGWAAAVTPYEGSGDGYLSVFTVEVVPPECKGLGSPTPVATRVSPRGVRTESDRSVGPSYDHLTQNPQVSDLGVRPDRRSGRGVGERTRTSTS